jgi:hypothetical protein
MEHPDNLWSCAIKVSVFFEIVAAALQTNAFTDP